MGLNGIYQVGKRFRKRGESLSEFTRVIPRYVWVPFWKSSFGVNGDVTKWFDEVDSSKVATKN